MGTRIGPITGATGPLKQQDTLIPGSLSTWGAKEALKAVYGGAYEDFWQMERAGLAAVNAATRRGTVVHDHIAAILRGETPTPTVETAPYIYGWSTFLAAERPEFIRVEQRVINLSAMYAGTFDFLAKIRGRVALGDVKTGRFKSSHILQLAAYSMCQMAGDSLTLDQWHRYWWEGDAADLEPLPRIQDFYVLLLKADGYELVPVQVTSADKRHYLHLVKTYHLMKAWDDAQKAVEVAA
jgi:hypothetical protein